MSKKEKKITNDGRMKKDEMVRRVVAHFQSDPQRVMNYKDVSAALGITKMVQKELLVNILDALVFDDFLKESVRGRYSLNQRGGFVVGRFERRSNGRNHLIPSDGSDPIFIAERNSLRAMNGDTVKVQMCAKRKGRDPEGEVTEIVERANLKFIGVLEVQKTYAFVVTDGKTLANDIFIPKEKLKGGKSGDKVVARITDWPSRAKNPIGEVVDVLGESGNNDTEMHAILAEFGLPYKYPEAVEAAANKISDEIGAEDIAKREDFRGTTTFTIDPRDAKDFDDALSLQKLDNGLWEVGVHIADVTHYVTPGSIIDKEALNRATSVYLVDRTIPMLPEHLSNGLCSLRPKEDKLCFSVIFEMNDKGEVKSHRIVRTIINSDRRFTYEEAQEIIETGNGDFNTEVLTLDRLSKILRERRFKEGAINFDRYEVKFEIDEKGKPISVYFKVSKDANHLIEEFMLLANRTVAEFVGRIAKGKSAKTFVYRIHDLPDPEKLDNFSTFIAKFGYKMRTGGSKSDVSKSINKLLDEVSGKREENLIETVCIRSMAKAVYSTKNIGHYGLAFDYYTHFTSPIRRYPDMMVHRLLESYLAGGRSVSAQKYEELCKHSSDMEQLASNAERSSIKYKQVEFMSDKLGMVFAGTISGVTEWGLYVEIDENKCEGMVPMRELDDDYYEFDDKNYCLIGRKSHKTYRLGDSVEIKVVRANLERRQLDFVITSK